MPEPVTFELNQRAWRICRQMTASASDFKVRHIELADGAQLIDCGIEVPGGLLAGLQVARVCTADLADIAFTTQAIGPWRGPAVRFATDHPVAACMASQYAGWKLAHDRYFAMASGPMRAAAQVEDLYDHIGYTEVSDIVVGVLETDDFPPTSLCSEIAKKCGVPLSSLWLLLAPTHCQAGTIQIVARAVETALHKLHELGFDIAMVESGFGVAPLPPLAADMLTALGRTNDAILYGGQVTLWVRASDAQLAELGPRIPSSASPDYGRSFREIFESYQRDFYQIDPALFSPAVISLNNLESGNSFQFGDVNADVIVKSFLG